MSGTGRERSMDVGDPTPSPFEPRLLVFVCNWCAYAGADKAGTAQRPYPANAHLIRLMCTGRWDPQFVMEAFETGADGVLILGCHPGDCHYKEQNYRTIQRHRLLVRLLAQRGIGEERCRLDFVAASEPEKFVSVVTENVDTLRQLGPLSGAPHGVPRQSLS